MGLTVHSHENSQILIGMLGCKAQKIWVIMSQVQNSVSVRTYSLQNLCYKSTLPIVMHNINSCERCIG